MEQQIVDTAVTEVTVYPDRARVTTGGRCDLTTGGRRLVVPNLPLAMETESIRVAGKGAAQVRLISIDVTTQFFEEAPAEKVQDLKEQIRQTEAELRVLEDEKAGWLAHAQYLKGLREATQEYAKGFSRGKTTVADQTELIRFLQEQDAQMRQAVRQVDNQQQQLKPRLQKLQRELKQLQASRPRKRYQAEVEVEVVQAGGFDLELTYVVNNARWQPLYDVRLVQTDGRYHIQWHYLAQVTQNTGQDWVKVALRVSTARPSLNQRLPELRPWYIDVYTPPPPPAPRRARAKAQAVAAAAPASMAMDADMVLAEPEEEAFAEAEIVTADARQEGAVVTFHVGGGSDIPSDNAPHKITLQQYEWEPKIDYLAVPKHTDAVFRRASVENQSGSPLLAGAASLFFGEEFIGRTKVDYTANTDEIELLFGAEERLTIERELVKRDVDKKMLRDQRKMRYGYEITLKNLLAEAVNVEVQDHIPQPRHEEIKVKLNNASPAPAEQSDLNLLEWQMALSAQAEETISYEFLVEYPRSLRVIGLNV